MELLPLVLIHGYPLDHTMWYGVIAALGSGIRVISPDLRGFGKSGPPAGEPAIEAYAQDILDLLKAEKIKQAVVGGMSMGGYVALAVAEMSPRSVAGLGLINSQSYADTEEGRAGRREMIKKVRAEGPDAAARAIMPKLFTPDAALDPDFQRFVTEGAHKAGVEGITWALEAMARRPDRSAILSDTKMPKLILHGSEDRIIPAEKARQMAALDPETNVLILNGASHAAALEEPDQVASTLRKFLEICSKVRA